MAQGGRSPIIWEPDNYPSVTDVGLTPEELRAMKYWEQHLPQTVAALKAQGPLAFPTAIRKAAHQTAYAEELEDVPQPDAESAAGPLDLSGAVAVPAAGVDRRARMSGVMSPRASARWPSRRCFPIQKKEGEARKTL